MAPMLPGSRNGGGLAEGSAPAILGIPKSCWRPPMSGPDLVVQGLAWGLKLYAQVGSLPSWRSASGRKSTGLIIQMMRVLA